MARKRTGRAPRASVIIRETARTRVREEAGTAAVVRRDLATTTPTQLRLEPVPEAERLNRG
jgi:hypothetical protein